MRSDKSIEFDVGLYTRAGSLFDAKRTLLAPNAVSTLARDVIERLANDRLRGGSGQADATPPDANGVRPELLDHFCDALLSSDAEAPLRVMNERLLPATSTSAELYAYIAAAAENLGERWDAGAISFVQVTIGVGKLYSLVRAIGLGRADDPMGMDPRKFAMFASVPGDQHTLGVTVAAEIFRDSGWEIDLLIARSHEALVERVQRTGPSVVGLSMNSAEVLDALARLVVALRLEAPACLVAVAVAPGIDRQKVQDLVDLDLMIEDAHSAQEALTQRLTRRG